MSASPIAAQLDLLELAGLLRLAAVQPEREYLFGHGLIQDAAYSTLLKTQRRAWHQAAGEVLEQLAASVEGASAITLAPMLAQHFSIAGDDARALRYFVRAADAAFERYALTEAGDYYSRALALATALRDPLDPALIHHVAKRYGLTLELGSRFEAALRHYEATETLARQRGDRALELAVLLEQAKIYATANLSYDPARSIKLLEQAAPLAEALDDHATQARLLWTLLLQNMLRGGDPDERLAFGEQALALARTLNLREQLAFILQDLFFAYGGTLRWDQARASLQAASQLWAELGHLVGQCETIERLSIVDMVTGDYERSLARVDEAHKIAVRIQSRDMQALSFGFVGLIHADRGDYARAIELAESAVGLGATSGNVTVLVGTRADLGYCYCELGANQRGLALAQAAHGLCVEQFPLLMGWSGAALARIHLLRGDTASAAVTLGQLQPYRDYVRHIGFMPTLWTHAVLAEAEVALAQGESERAATLMAEVAATARASGMRFRLPDFLYLRGRALLGQGQLALARAELQAARLEAVALDARRIHWRILAALAEVETHTGQPDQAVIWRREARRLIEYIVAHAPAELRGSFLAQPDVQYIWNEGG